MNKPTISSEFTMEDIRKLRNYNSSRHLIMTVAEIRNDLKPHVELFEKLMLERNSLKADPK